MSYRPYVTDENDTYESVIKRVRTLWTFARREFGIKLACEFTGSILNPESMANLPAVHSHVIERKEQIPLVIYRLSKDEMELPDIAETVLPREMAHVICKLKPTLGDPYHKDAGWQKVYKRLGGKY